MDELRQRVDAARVALRVAISEYQKHARYFDRAPVLDDEMLASCRVVGSRESLLARLPKGGRAVEIGTDRGKWARYMLDTLRPGELHVVDLSFERLEPGLLDDEIRVGTVILHEGDSSSYLSTMPPGYFDVIYVDGDHSYDGVKKDIDAAVPALASDGWLVFNDYTAWSAASMSPCGVARAVNELCLGGGWKWEYLALQSLGYYDVALRRA